MSEPALRGKEAHKLIGIILTAGKGIASQRFARFVRNFVVMIINGAEIDEARIHI